MPQQICPTCGDRFYTANPKVELTERQRNIYRAIGTVARREGGKLASTAAIAAEIGWSVSTVWRELVYLEQVDEVSRPAGVRKGWAQVVRYGIKEERLPVAI